MRRRSSQKAVHEMVCRRSLTPVSVFVCYIQGCCRYLFAISTL